MSPTKFINDTITKRMKLSAYACAVLALFASSPFAKTNGTRQLPVPYYSDTSRIYSIELHSYYLIAHDRHTSVSDSIYGHPLGEISIDFWINDSILVASSGCCESLDWFEIDFANSKSQHFETSWRFTSTKKKILTLIEQGKHQSAHRMMRKHYKMREVDYKFLIWKNDWPEAAQPLTNTNLMISN